MAPCSPAQRAHNLVVISVRVLLPLILILHRLVPLQQLHMWGLLSLFVGRGWHDSRVALLVWRSLTLVLPINVAAVRLELASVVVMRIH